MKSFFTKIFFFCLTVTWSLGLFAHGTIIFPNVEHGDGYIDVKIYDSKESFLDEELAIESVRKRVQKGEVVVPLRFGQPREGQPRESSKSVGQPRENVRNPGNGNKFIIKL